MFDALFEQPMVAGDVCPFTLPRWIACAPFEEYLGMQIIEAGGGRSVLSMEFRVKHAQGLGLMHGGAVTALADTAVAMAIKTLLPEGTMFATTDLSLKFLAPIKSGVVKAVASAEFSDERTITGRAEVLDGDGVIVATFNSIFRVKRVVPVIQKG